MPYILFVIFCLFCGLGRNFAQINTVNEHDFIDIVDLSEGNSNIENQINYDVPSNININNCTAQELAELGILTGLEISAILEYKNINGKFIAFEELQCVRILSLDKIRRLKPYLNFGETMGSTPEIGKLLGSLEHALYFKIGRTLEEAKGFKKDTNNISRYAGSQEQIVLRYRSNYTNKLRLGMHFEKDAGEKVFVDNQITNPELLSAYMHLHQQSNILYDLIIGDFNFSFGQGLIGHNSFNNGKALNPVQNIRYGKPLNKHSALDENNFYRGIAYRGIYGKVSLVTFLSSQKRDASLIQDTLKTEIKSLLSSGYHRTESERINRKNIRHKAWGLRLSFEFKHLKIAINQVYSKFNHNIAKPTQAYLVHRPNDSIIYNKSIDFNFRKNRLFIFGELAADRRSNMAGVIGMLFSINRNSSTSLTYRFYGKGYHALRSNAVGESSMANAENGITLTIESQLSQNISFKFMSDIWLHPWLKYRLSRPSFGKEIRFRLKYQAQKTMFAYLQFKFKHRYRDITSSEYRLPLIKPQNLYRLRIHANYKTSMNLELRSKVEWSLYAFNSSSHVGSLLLQDFIYKKREGKLSTSIRIALFNTDNFENRIYAYENGLLLENRLPAYLGKGMRYYINIRYNTLRKLTLELRWSRTIYIDRKTISTGLQEIAGNTKSDISMQMKVKF